VVEGLARSWSAPDSRCRTGLRPAPPSAWASAQGTAACRPGANLRTGPELARAGREPRRARPVPWVALAVDQVLHDVPASDSVQVLCPQRQFDRARIPAASRPAASPGSAPVRSPPVPGHAAGSGRTRPTAGIKKTLDRVTEQETAGSRLPGPPRAPARNQQAGKLLPASSLSTHAEHGTADPLYHACPLDAHTAEALALEALTLIVQAPIREGAKAGDTMKDGPPESSAAQPIPPQPTATRMVDAAVSTPIASTDARAMVGLQSRGIRLFSTCPPSSQFEGGYLRKVQEVAKWCDNAGIEGILVYTDNSLVDPWLVSQVILSCTSRLAPLVAIQPVYMHPYTAAKMVTTFSYLYRRPIYLNMVAGGFVNDLIALGDRAEHDDRYDRLVEYVSIMKCLFNDPGPVTFTGIYFAVKNLAIKPQIPPELVPEVFVSGTSDAGVAAAEEIGATSISYPGTPSEKICKGVRSGIRIGIIARNESRKAWQIAHERFPVDRKGQLTHALARKVSDSAWYEQLSELGDSPADSPYWLVPFKNYKTFCPYLVGSYAEVRREVAKYIQGGVQTFILDVPPDQEELYHTAIVFDGLTRMPSERTPGEGIQPVKRH
jgi:alkanesulfonate monooxygenase